MAFGPGAWEERLTAAVRETFIRNAPTFLDEARDPDALSGDLDALRGVRVPAVLSQGTESPPTFGLVIDRLAPTMPDCRRNVFQGASHNPHVSHPGAYVRTLVEFARSAAAPA